ncbi:unnamed protein product (macronuclear) [Paramecium tetraurelia]|uniref:Uncharacterized protein n=1 Tax=Paramecium tetraurelia TaxID=5888 RepID=A0BX63_PARTE|nr:uncharacterized protein GSPATT00032982001 [Paramecium tetraurelia]CAK63130.1 unnamed protein product [Paramecium tetraurelia]|eukprot:XP_001430528.1 hypothetical protein (macronuclear) [Paramecium tetraurelia strain d4-2]
MNDLFSSMKESIKLIFQIQKTEDDRFLYIIKNNSNPFECSSTELDYIVKIIEGNIFEDHNLKKKQASSELNEAIESLSKVLFIAQEQRKFIQNIENQFTKVNKEKSIITLKGFQKSKNTLEQTTFNLIISNEGNQVYQKDGQILRIETKQPQSSKDEQILNNIEQIKNLQFIGGYGADGQKINLWHYFWKGEKIGGGVYSEIGQKQGMWQDICENYWDKKNVVEEGQYEDGKRIGAWNFIYNNQNIGGGQYDNEGYGTKKGNWIELADQFMNQSQVFTSGRYHNNKKIDRWDIIFRGQSIGGGSYEYQLEGDSIKIGKWIELNDRFYDDSQVTHVGLYCNGKKVGKWDVYYQENYGDKTNHQIGGGQYEDQLDGDQMKIGKWIELNDGFYDNSQVTNVGEYKNGRKVGKWVIMYKGQEIGGGSYECWAKGDSIKIGTWIELSYGFYDDSQVTYVGEYQNGKKVGNWDICYKFYLFETQNIIMQRQIKSKWWRSV